MPELPEVESARRSLERTIVGKVIASVDVLRPTAVRGPSPQQFATTLVGKQVSDIRRRGKALLFDLKGRWVLVFRFMLWGLVRFAKGGAMPDAQTGLVVDFRGGSSLEFRELQLSSLQLHRKAELDRNVFFARMGVDPLSREFTGDRFRTLLQARGTIKGVLTAQERIAGIGNLWAHEILHAARIRPNRRADSLTGKEVSRLHRAITRVLRQAISRGGEPEFVDAVGRRGRYRLAVYGRGGSACPRGDGTIRAGRLGGRPSFFCPACQR